MLTLAPLKEKSEIEFFYGKNGLTMNEFSGCVLCKSGDEVLGFCLYDLTDKKMTIRHIEPQSDLSLGDGILRSTLHVAAERSIMNAVYDTTVPEEFFRKIGFIKDETEKTLQMDKLFSSCCSCKE